MSIKKIDICLVRPGDIIKLKDDPDAPWWHVKYLQNDVLILHENTMLWRNEKKIKICPRRKRYVFCEV